MIARTPLLGLFVLGAVLLEAEQHGCGSGDFFRLEQHELALDDLPGVAAGADFCIRLGFDLARGVLDGMAGGAFVPGDLLSFE